MNKTCFSFISCQTSLADWQEMSWKSPPPSANNFARASFERKLQRKTCSDASSRTSFSRGGRLNKKKSEGDKGGRINDMMTEPDKVLFHQCWRLKTSDVLFSIKGIFQCKFNPWCNTPWHRVRDQVFRPLVYCYRGVFSEVAKTT